MLASMCDRTIVMKDGEIVFDGSFDDLQKTSHYEKIFRTQNESTL
jgi:ABC-type multidrug transport system fused ATPase/permease subunit